MSDSDPNNDHTQSLLISLWQDDNAWESAIAFKSLPIYLEAIRRALKERADLLHLETDPAISNPIEQLNSFETFREAARDLLRDLTSLYADYDLQTGEFYRFYLNVIYTDTHYYNKLPLHNISMEDAVTNNDGSLRYSYEYSISNGVLHFKLDDCSNPQRYVNALAMGFNSANSNSFYLGCGLPISAVNERLMDPLSWIRGMHRALNRLLYPVTTLSVFTEHLNQCTYQHKYVSKTFENGISYISFNNKSQTISGDPSMESLWTQCPWENSTDGNMFGSAFSDTDNFIELDGSIVTSQSAERYCFSSVLANKSCCSCGDLPVKISMWEKRSKKESRHESFLLEDGRYENIWTPIFTDLQMQQTQSVPFQSERMDLPANEGAWASDHCRVALEFTYDFEQEKKKLNFQQKVI